MKLLFYSGSAGETTSRIRRLERLSSDNPQLLELLEGATKVLRRQATSFLDRTERAELGVDITSLMQLVENPLLYVPARWVLDLVAQLGETVLFLSEHPLCDDPQDLMPIGVGCGVLTATVVAASSSAHQVVQLGFHVIAVAFRLAVELDRRTRRIDNSAGSWKYLETSAGSAEVDMELVKVNHGVPVHRRGYVGIRGMRVTVCGPPDTLAKLSIDEGELKACHLDRMPGSMYASHLPPLEFSELVGPLKQEKRHRLRYQLCSPCDGRPYEATYFHDLVEQAIRDISGRPLDLYKLAKSVASAARPLPGQTHLIAIGSDSPAIADFESLISQYLDVTCTYGDLSESEDRSTCRKLVAIVGMSGRFPESDDLDEFWALLNTGTTTAKEIPSTRFPVNEQPDFMTPDEDNISRFGNFLKDPGAFDHRLFGISPAEAIQMDPIQRLSLMVTYEALESAGYGGCHGSAGPSAARVATYLGHTTDDWKTINQQRGIDTHYLPAVNRSFAPGRLNRYFGWGGPFYSIDTGCSSSATCISLARDALLDGQIDMAVAGGVSLLTTPEWFLGLSKGGFLSTTGECKTFANSADGYCRGEAVGVVVLKRLEDALQANDNILAVISSAARNSNARSSSSITSPSQAAQEALYHQVLRDSGVLAEDVGFVEMHGTGTQAGDRIEMAAVRRVFASDRSQENPLIVGGVKASVGHSEAAAGVVSLIKAVLMLQHGKAPTQPGWPFVLNSAFVPLAYDHIQIAEGQPFTARSTSNMRTIAVNSFDAAGGNVCMIVNDGPIRDAKEPTGDSRPHHVVVLSGHSPAVCESHRIRLREYLLANPNISLPDLAYTTTARRIHQSYRCAYTANSMADLVRKLVQPCNPILALPERPVVFLFTGQGSQYVGMGVSLYQHSPDFRRHVDHYERICQHDHQFGFLEIITSGEKLATRSAGQVQVALVALQVALANYLIGLGLQPSLVIGHSLGEYAALCISKVLSITDVLWLVYQRAMLLEKACEPSTYGMLAVNLPPLAIQKSWATICEISCYNSSNMTTISGPLSHITKIQNELGEQGINATRLHVQYAFHSSQMDPVLASFESVASIVPFRSPQIAVASTLLGRIVQPGEQVFNANYLTRHMREPVEFSGAVQACEAHGALQDKTVVIEIGPHPTCIGLLESNVRHTKPTTLTTLQRGKDDWLSISACLSQAFSAGLPIDWHSYHVPHLNYLTPLQLPAYAFELRSFWEPFRTPAVQVVDMHGTDGAASRMLHSSTLHTVRSVSENETTKTVVFASSANREDLRQAIEGHSVDGMAICPTSVLMDMAFSATVYLIHNELQMLGLIGLELKDLKITAALVPDVADNELTVHIDATMQRGSQSVDVTISSESGSRPTRTHASCQVLISPECEIWDREWAQIRHLVSDRLNSIGNMGSSEACTLNQPFFYRIFNETVQYSTPYKTVVEAAIPTNFHDAAAVLQLNEVHSSDKFLCNPYAIDSVIHLAGFMLNSNPLKPADMIYISNYVGSLRVHGLWTADQRYKAYVAIRDEHGNRVCVCDVYVVDCNHKLLLSCTDIRFQRLEKAVFQDLIQQQCGQVGQRTQHVGNPRLPSISRSPSNPCSSTQSKISTSILTPRTSSGIPDAWSVLLSVISAKSGLAREEIESGSSFTEMGIDSQLSISITAEFRKQTGIELPASLLNSTFSVADVKQELHGLGHVQALIPANVVSSKGCAPRTIAASPKEVGNGSDALLIVVARILGIEADELDDSTTWESIGMDSMQSIRTLSEFKKESGIELPASFFMDYSTVARVRQELDEGQEMASPPPTGVDVDALRSTDRPVRTEDPASRAILLQGSVRSTDPPLFLLTDGSGTTEAYIHFPRLPKGRCTYGLESPYVNNPLDFNTTLSALATIFIKTIRRIQPSGPYFIGGWSIGGKYAYEVSRQLSLAGEEIALLLILDTRPPRPRPVKVNVEFGTIEDIGMTGARGRNLIEEFTQRERDHLYASCRVNTKEQTTAYSECQRRPRLSAIVWATKGLNDHPDPQRHNPRITRKAAMGPVEEEEDEIAKGGVEALRTIYKSWFFGKRQDFGPNGWESWILGSKGAVGDLVNEDSAKLVVEKTEGDHFSMVAPPDVYALGEIIVRLVEEAHDLTHSQVQKSPTRYEN